MKRKIINFIKEILFKLFKLRNRIYNVFNSKKYSIHIALVSCDKWKNKVKEDWYLKHYLNKLKVSVDIISWQDKNIDYSVYDSIIIRSIWGFPLFKNEFEKWLNKLENENIKVFNSIDIIKYNYDKEVQFNLLSKNNINTIETVFININEDLEKNLINLHKNKFSNYNLLIIKPTISESSKDTYLIGKTEKKYSNLISVNDVLSKYSNYKSKVMVQPFIDEIFEGEYSICCLGGKITHAVLKYVNNFTNTNIVKYVSINELDNKIIQIVNKILKISEYQNSLYMRVDLVKVKNNFLIMEVELLDPNLFITFVSDKKLKDKILKDFCKKIVLETKK